MKILLILLVTASCAFPRAILSTYAAKYSTAARLHPNRRYSPDRMNVASGWREYYKHDLILCVGVLRIRVRVTDVMHKRYDSCRTMHVDCSPRVMRACGLKHQRAIDSVLCDGRRVDEKRFGKVGAVRYIGVATQVPMKSTPFSFRPASTCVATCLNGIIGLRERGTESRRRFLFVPYVF